MATAAKQTWHITNWGTWGWLETAIKVVGAVTGILAFIASQSIDGLRFTDNPELGAVIILGVMTFLAVGQIVIRFTQREVVSFAYAILNFLGHAGMLIALLRTPDVSTYAIVFGVAYIVGALIQQHYFRLTGFSEGGRTTAQMVMFSRAALMLPYILLIVFILI